MKITIKLLAIILFMGTGYLGAEQQERPVPTENSPGQGGGTRPSGNNPGTNPNRPTRPGSRPGQNRPEHNPTIPGKRPFPNRPKPNELKKAQSGKKKKKEKFRAPRHKWGKENRPHYGGTIRGNAHVVGWKSEIPSMGRDTEEALQRLAIAYNQLDRYLTGLRNAKWIPKKKRQIMSMKIRKARNKVLDAFNRARNNHRILARADSEGKVHLNAGQRRSIEANARMSVRFSREAQSGINTVVRVLPDYSPRKSTPLANSFHYAGNQVRMSTIPNNSVRKGVRDRKSKSLDGHAIVDYLTRERSLGSLGNFQIMSKGELDSTLRYNFGRKGSDAAINTLEILPNRRKAVRGRHCLSQTVDKILTNFGTRVASYVDMQVKPDWGKIPKEQIELDEELEFNGGHPTAGEKTDSNEFMAAWQAYSDSIGNGIVDGGIYFAEGGAEYVLSVKDMAMVTADWASTEFGYSLHYDEQSGYGSSTAQELRKGESAMMISNRTAWEIAPHFFTLGAYTVYDSMKQTGEGFITYYHDPTPENASALRKAATHNLVTILSLKYGLKNAKGVPGKFMSRIRKIKNWRDAKAVARDLKVTLEMKEDVVVRLNQKKNMPKTDKSNAGKCVVWEKTMPNGKKSNSIGWYDKNGQLWLRVDGPHPSAGTNHNIIHTHIRLKTGKNGQAKWLSLEEAISRGELSPEFINYYMEGTGAKPSRSSKNKRRPTQKDPDYLGGVIKEPTARRIAESLGRKFDDGKPNFMKVLKDKLPDWKPAPGESFADFWGKVWGKAKKNTKADTAAKAAEKMYLEINGRINSGQKPTGNFKWQKYAATKQEAIEGFKALRDAYRLIDFEHKRTTGKKTGNPTARARAQVLKNLARWWEMTP